MTQRFTTLVALLALVSLDARAQATLAGAVREDSTRREGRVDGRGIRAAAVGHFLHSNSLGETAMLISKAMNAHMNEQIGHEFGASLQYVNIAAYFDDVGLPVLRDHFFKQGDEERGHAMKFVRYLLDAGGSVQIPAIPAPRHGFASAEEAVTLALEWENSVTKQITGLLDRATSEKDYLSHDFLEWFVREQLEEVSGMDMLLKMVRRSGESGLMLVENALASGRTLTMNEPGE